MNKLLLLALTLSAVVVYAQETEPVKLAPVQPNEAMTVGGYLGMVNGQPMFVDDILIPLDGELRKAVASVQEINTFKKLARDLINREMRNHVGDLLVYKAAQETMTEDDQGRLSFYMNRTEKDLRTKYGAAEGKADTDLMAKGSSFRREVETMRRKAIVEIYMYKMIRPQVQLTRGDILKQYQQNIKDYTVEAQVDLYTITIPFSRYLMESDPAAPERKVPIADPTPEQLAAARQAANAKAKEVLQKLAAGEDFAVLANDLSADPKAKSGGRWRNTRVGSLRLEELEKLAFALPSNSSPTIMEVRPDKPKEAAVIVVKVGEVTQSHVKTFGEVQGEIDKKLRDAKYAELTNKYYQELLGKAAVEGVDKMADTCLDAAVTRYALR